MTTTAVKNDKPRRLRGRSAEGRIVEMPGGGYVAEVVLRDSKPAPNPAAARVRAKRMISEGALLRCSFNDVVGEDADPVHEAVQEVRSGSRSDEMVDILRDVRDELRKFNAP